ncbi:MAG TPA: class I SAM-dependent methyltransferase [Casimicrobiaceae bacterium]|nr:class I SAM-dependent methyltransferase [Casimicrobiaceae bacterium]
MNSESRAPQHEGLAPSPWILRHAHLVPPEARVLDLACGSGRHARLFAHRGARVLAVDRDTEMLAALEGVAGIETRRIDLEASDWPFANERFDAIVVTNYLHRPRLSQIVAAVADDGTLLYETFARGNEAYGRPSNPAFLLEPGELVAAVGGRLVVVEFAQGLVVADGRRAVVQRIAAVGLKRHWPPPLALEA